MHVSPHFPLKVLGRLSPILGWVEDISHGGIPEHWRGPEHWRDRPEYRRDRERRWLIRELPTYSYDNLDDILTIGRSSRRTPRLPWKPAAGAPMPIDPPDDYDLIGALGELGDRYFVWAGDELCVRGGRMVEVHELAQRFPVHHLIRLRHAEAAAHGYLDPEVARILPDRLGALHTEYQGIRDEVREGLSEGHLHLTAILSAEESWADQILGHHPHEFDEQPAEMRRLLDLGRLIIPVLALAVCHQRLGHLWPPGQEFETPETPSPDHALETLLAGLDALYWASTRQEEQDRRRFLSRAIQWVSNRFEESLATRSGTTADELQLLIRLIRWHSRRDRSSIRALAGIRRRVRALQDLHFAIHRALLAERRQPGSIASPPSLLLRTFFRYLVLHTHHWYHAIQASRSTGLRYFRGYSSSRYRKHVVDDEQAHALAFERMVEDPALRTVEGRLSPPDGGSDEYVPWLLSFAASHQRDLLDRFGIVIHFIKDEHPSKYRHFPTSSVVRDVRHGPLRREVREQAFQFLRILRQPDPINRFFVGIDCANLELTSPPEVFAPIFHFLCKHPVDFGTRIAARRLVPHGATPVSSPGQRRLGMTYHVGEDFRHLLSGLRAIDEAITFFALRPGDRLGHATALGIEPELWAAQSGFQAILSRQEWLDTMVWVCSKLGSQHPGVIALGLNAEIRRQARYVYQTTSETLKIKDRTIATLHDMWRLRQLDPYSIDLVRLSQGSLEPGVGLGAGMDRSRWDHIQMLLQRSHEGQVGSDDAYKLLALYWYDGEVRKRGDERMEVPMDENKSIWLDLCRDLQAMMQDLVRRRELIVEANPSSNRIIGPMNSIAEHPIFRLTLDEEDQLRREVRVTVNTDNPGIFATSLAHELYMLAEVLLERNVPEAQVSKWIRWLRKNGNLYSFTRFADTGQEMSKHLEYVRSRYWKVEARMQGERPQDRKMRARLQGKLPWQLTDAGTWRE